ncbi:MAG: NAD(P)/FAD-dependent oxidoreductase [Deltaproteobacteria bacterium]|nr:NAD(P)/FAD-dependent oxidoreductase [Deltaproteobacteria bacterium]
MKCDIIEKSKLNNLKLNLKLENNINIAGAGPAGLTAAIVLAKHGYKPKVYEMSPDVGHRMNGDFQGLENWSGDKDIIVLLKELGIDVNFLCVPYYEGNIYAPKIAPLKIKSERPIFYLVKRGAIKDSLDNGLKEQAVHLGVEIVFNRRIESGEGKTIIAGGPKRADFIAEGITFDTANENLASVLFNDEIAPKGYAYLIINNGFGTMATVIYENFKNTKKYFKNLIDFFKNEKNIDIKNEKKIGGFGNFFIRDSNTVDKKIYVGESAGFQDYLWGFGLRYAIVSGYLAAMSIITDSDYDFLWKKEVKPMLETSLVNRYLIEKFGDFGYRYIAKKFAEGNPCNFLKRNYNKSFLKNLLLPIAKNKYKKHESLKI